MKKMNNEVLVDQFRDYLEKVDGEKKKLPRRLSLSSFYEEMISLKNEIRIESRIVKQGLDRFQETAELIEHGNQKIDFLIEKSRVGQKAAPPPAEQPRLQGLLDLYDSVRASLQTLQQSKDAIPWFQRWKRYDETILLSVSRGQEMILKKIVELLKECGVAPMDVVRRKFDPHTMRAVGTDSCPGLEDGMVSSESRTGFILHDKILRLADVRVNRL
jgi:molecular chaperone GrpE